MAKEATLSKIKSTITAHPDNHGTLGRRIEIGSKSHITKNKAGMKAEFFTPTIELLIGIGNDHVAHLIMDEDAWVAFKKGQKTHINTLKDFTEKFL
jgi:hypothetical protein